MRYKPERALTQGFITNSALLIVFVEMRYQPERALTLNLILCFAKRNIPSRNEV